MTVTDDSRRYQPATGMVSRVVGDEVVVLDVSTNRAHRLEGAWARAWRTCDPMAATVLNDDGTGEVGLALEDLVRAGLLTSETPVDPRHTAPPVRRAVLRAGLAGGALAGLAGIESIVLPSAAWAASGDFSWAAPGAGTYSVLVPPSVNTLAFTLRAGSGGGGGTTAVGATGGGPGGAGAEISGLITLPTGRVADVTLTVVVGSGGGNGQSGAGGVGFGNGGNGAANGGGGGGAGSAILVAGGTVIAVAGGGGGGGANSNNGNNTGGQGGAAGDVNNNGSSIARAGGNGVGGGAQDPPDRASKGTGGATAPNGGLNAATAGTGGTGAGGADGQNGAAGALPGTPGNGGNAGVDGLGPQSGGGGGGGWGGGGGGEAGNPAFNNRSGAGGGGASSLLRGGAGYSVQIAGQGTNPGGSEGVSGNAGSASLTKAS